MGMPAKLFHETQKYLVGPYEEEEIIREHPEELYISGLLFPKQSRPSAEDFEVLDAGAENDDHSSTDESRQSPPRMLQNSLGLRCNLAPEITQIEAEISFARYFPEESGWKRVPVRERILLRIEEDTEQNIFDSDGEVVAKLSWKVDKDRNKSHSQYKMLSIFLSNEQDEPRKGENNGAMSYAEAKNIRNQRILFQSEIRLNAENKNTFLGTEIFRERNILPDEDLSLDLLYRNRGIYGQGYNCSADWDKNGTSPSFVKTELLPQYQSKQIRFGSKTDKDRPDHIDMMDVEDAKNPDELYALLKDIPERYDKWIKKNLSDHFNNNGSENDYRSIAKTNLEKCTEALARIKDGLEILRNPDNDDVYEAFKITNRVMLYQMVRYKFSMAKSKKEKGLPRTPTTRTKGKNFWRPFQLAFLLMNIRGMSDPNSESGLAERGSVDLLWFPTGGGKTEAYLALSAFSLVLRRLRRAESSGEGVSVIMRYTLRLLTIQQFERAAALICALEVFRRKDPRVLGEAPFLIGLWVGWGLTPNSWEDSVKSLVKLSNNEEPDAGSPAQLFFCPWCGEDIDHRNYQVDTNRTKWTIVHCKNPGCDFYSRDKHDTARALPVLTVDFDIYRRCPSILIATVDKLARLPWKPESSSLFGIVDRRCERCGFLTSTSNHPEGYHREKHGRSQVVPIDRLSPPDLIVQDELHLLTGPIGTMVGLYETAVDYLCSWNPNGECFKPKIVASTATIRGAGSQIKRLFNRNSISVFPPPGINFDDVFFWWESQSNGRKYVGVSYSHRSMVFALGRLYAVLLQNVFESKRNSENPTLYDPYWTLVGYFNSGRELGGAIRLVEDDVKSNIGKMVSLFPERDEESERPIGRPEELTGRRSGLEIREIRKRLETSSESGHAIDVLLATNMISVGIDIPRLGLMVVKGQTKGASEYIQAAGRIGRRDDIPGIVFTLYNPYKPRDLSHYESFVGDHLVLQKSVEAAGLTPFSDQAMNRALHAVLIGIIRATMPILSSNDGADSFLLGNPEIKKMLEFILSRYGSVQNIERNHEDYKKVADKLQQFLDNWKQYIDDSHREGHQVFYYDDSQYGRSNDVPRKNRTLLTDFATSDVSNSEEYARRGFPKPTPGSLRDVETMAKMFYEG